MINFNETITLFIEDTSIRLLVSQGMKIKKKAEVKLDPGMVKGAVVLKEPEVAARISELLRSQEVVGKKILLGFSGLHSLTRPVTLPELPKSMVPEAIAREARRVLPVPLDQLYLSWRTVPSPKGRIQAFMAANPRKAIDSLMKTLRTAGLEASHMTIKPLALTKAVPENCAIILDLQSTELDIIILADGIPQPIRTITLPEAELTQKQKLDIIVSDLDRTIKFFDQNNPEKPLAKTVPLYVSGEIMGQKEMYKVLAETSGHQVKTLSSLIKGLEDADLGNFMVNIAMAIKSGPAFREGTFPISNLNMLPAPYQPKPIAYSKLIAIPGAAAVIGVVVPMLLLMQSASANIDTLQKELDSANAVANKKIAEQQTLNRSIADLEKQASAAKLSVDNVEVTWKIITTQQEIVSGDVNLALASAPASIAIEGITESGGTLTVKGSAPYESAVLNYARALDTSKRFTQTTVSTLDRVVTPATETEPEQVSFDFTLTMERG